MKSLYIALQGVCRGTVPFNSVQTLKIMSIIEKNENNNIWTAEHVPLCVSCAPSCRSRCTAFPCGPWSVKPEHHGVSLLISRITTYSIIAWMAISILFSSQIHFSPFLSAPRPTPTIPHRFNEIKTIIFLGIAMKWRKWSVKHTLLQLRAWMAATSLRSYDFMLV